MPLFPEGSGTKSRPIKTISCTPRCFYYRSRIFSLLQVNVSRTIGILHARWNAFHFKSHHFYWHSPKLEDHTHKQNHFWSSHHVKVLDKRQTLFSVLNDATLDSLLKLQCLACWSVQRGLQTQNRTGTFHAVAYLTLACAASNSNVSFPQCYTGKPYLDRSQLTGENWLDKNRLDNWLGTRFMIITWIVSVKTLLRNNSTWQVLKTGTIRDFSWERVHHRGIP